MANIDEILKDRGASYGNFLVQSATSERIKDAIHTGPNWHRMAPDQREAMDMIAVKFGRLLSGDPNHEDSWRDVVGYAKLVADRLLEQQRELAVKSAVAAQGGALQGGGRFLTTQGQNNNNAQQNRNYPQPNEIYKEVPW